MLKWLVVWSILLLVLCAGLVAVYYFYTSQRADYTWDASVTAPSFLSTHPVVTFDEGHNNVSTAGLTGRYWPFARLLGNDGFDFRRSEVSFSESTLAGADILVIVNAAGDPKPGTTVSLIPENEALRAAYPAFTDDEIQVVKEWVFRGGSLLLIADHAPFGAASASLAATFGVAMHKGFVEVPNEVSDPLLFSSENGGLGNHPILTGTGTESAIHRVMTFTGQSLDGPLEATPLLNLPDSAIEYVPSGDSLAPSHAGKTQGLALEFGRGRVVVLGEAAMLTAQVYDSKAFGMNLPGNDNRQFALNILHWLSRKI